MGTWKPRIVTTAAAFSAGLLALAVPGALAATRSASTTSSASRGITKFFVDCLAGSDAHSGSASAPWRTLTPANEASLGPGMQLALRRGCVFDHQRLDARWTGTASNPIVITAFGSGADPVIKNGRNQDVKISGAWLVIDHLSATVDPTSFSSCGEPLGTHVGFNVLPGAHDIVIQNSAARREMAGIRLLPGSSRIHVLHNLLEQNNMVDAFHADPTKDLGAWGVLVNSNDSEVAWNTFHNNTAACSNQGYKLQSNSVELYAAKGNLIDHNQSFGDRVFSELGSTAQGRGQVVSSNNTYAYNLFSPGSMATSRFIVTRGPRDTRYGPVLNTVVVHNSTYQTASDSLGIVCGQGCGSTVLSANSNVIWANGTTLYCDANCSLEHNIVWSAPAHSVEAPMSSQSNRITDPRYAGAPAKLYLSSGSPALGYGLHTGSWTVDVYGYPLPATSGPVSAGAVQR